MINVVNIALDMKHNILPFIAGTVLLGLSACTDIVPVDVDTPDRHPVFYNVTAVNAQPKAEVQYKPNTKISIVSGGSTTEAPLFKDGKGGPASGYDLTVSKDPMIVFELPDNSKVKFVFVRNDQWEKTPFPTEMFVETSVNGTEWKEQGPIMTNYPKERANFWIEFREPVACKYVRLSKFKRDDSTTVRIEEFDIWGMK